MQPTKSNINTIQPFIKKFERLLVLVTNGKSLKVFSPIVTRQKINKLKSNTFLRLIWEWISQSNLSPRNLRDRQIQRITDKISLSRAKNAKAFNCFEHCSDHLDKFLEAECGLAYDWESTCDPILGKPKYFYGIYLKEPYQVLTVMTPKIYPPILVIGWVK